MKKIILVIAIILISSFSYAANWDFPYNYPVASDLQIKADYDVRTDGQPVSLCLNRRGEATSDTSWICYKYTYDGSNQMTVKQTAVNVSYDNRASATYE